ncbi:MAG: DUF3108 domain-containing protein [Rhodospirillales bacterium]|nr:DUF3108 domain-containing protein [Rhodospirillales bacterium]MDE2574855.1 DUF3108 domain-containing protein [Rhodospirillales bacterium]
MRRAALLLLTLLLPRPAGAEAPPTRLSFAIYAAGLNVLDIDSRIALDPDRYRIDLAFHTVGMFGLLFHSRIDSFVQGAWQGADTLPLRFASWGVVRGQPRRVVIDYRAGQPILRDLQPLHDKARDPVSAAQQADTIDTLSAMAELVRRVSTTGRCDGRARIFDGRRLSEVRAVTVGPEILPRTGRSSFAGVALRCDVQGRQLGGFVHDESMARLTRIHHSSVWLARLAPGGPALPVRVRFETRYFGHAIAYITASGPATDPQAAAQR